MASIGQADHQINGISRLASMHPAAFSNAWAPADYRERYMMSEMHSSSYHGRSTFNRNVSSTASAYQQQQHPPGPMESSSSVWQQQRQASGSDIMPHHHHGGHSADNNNSMRAAGGGSSRVTAMLGSPDSMNRDSPASLQSSSSELYESGDTTTVVSGADWQQFVDSGVRYAMLPPTNASSGPLQQQQHGSSAGGGVNEGAVIRELIGRLGGSSMGSTNNACSLTSTSPQLPSQRAGGVVDLAVLKHGGGNHTSWNSSNAPTAVEMTTSNVTGLTVDPSKGGLSLNGAVVAAGLTTSHCLSPFAADPGFAERAARFSSFGNGNYARPFSASTVECGGASRIRSRSGTAAPLSELSSSKSNLSGTPSCPPVTGLRESPGPLNNNNGSTVPPELRPDSVVVVRETHSVRRGVTSDDLLASVHHHDDDEDDDEDDDDDNSAEGNYALLKGSKPAVKLLSRTASNLLAEHADEDEEEEEAQGGTTTTTSADASSNPGRIRGISTSSLDQAGTGGPREACPSPGVSSGATDISAKKRKTSLGERSHNKDVGSMSTVSSHGERDAKTTESEDAKAKRSRRGDGSKDREEIMRSKAERSSSETSGETSPRSMKAHSKPTSEPPSKPDYIHVRARRGQATDSHSLAERVRREKISERMKFLQDLVPGCSKVTGKAVMLDEIINYVQSLQRQVEFLSMKLASVNPRLDFNIENFLGKEGPHPGSQAVLSLETSIPYPPMHSHLLQHQEQLPQGLDYQLHSEATLRRGIMSMPIPPTNPSFGSGVCQTVWDDGELQSIVQMGIGHTPSMSSPASQCHLPPGQVKVELHQSPISCL